MDKKALTELTKTRGSTHGQYADNLAGVETIREVLYNEYMSYLSRVDGEWSDAAAGALASMAIKISRIIHGDPTFQDHFDDLQAYASFYKATR